MVNQTTASRIRAYVKENPEAKDKEVGEALGILSNRVSTIRWRDKNIGAPKRKYKPRKKKPANNWTTLSVGTTPYETMKEALEILKTDMVNSPPHYKVGGIETIDYIQAKLTIEEFRGYLQGNILKYSSRMGYKGNASEDVGKLLWYVNKLKEVVS
jgi:hypothetical protein